MLILHRYTHYNIIFYIHKTQLLDGAADKKTVTSDKNSKEIFARYDTVGISITLAPLSCYDLNRYCLMTNDQ